MVQTVLQQHTRDLGARLRFALGAGIALVGTAVLAARGLAGLAPLETGPLAWASALSSGLGHGAWQGVIASSIAGAATGLGAVALWGLRERRGRRMPVFLAASAGMMLAAALFSLLWPAFQVARGGWMPAVVAAVAAGWLGMLGLDRALPHLHATPGATDGVVPDKALRLMIIAIAAHNLPEGFAVGAGFGGGESLGWVTALAIGLQNVPEGLVVATALWSLGSSRPVAALGALGTGLIEPLGAAIGAAMVSVAPQALPVALGLAAGAMLFVVFDEMLPTSWRHWRTGGRLSLPLAFGLGFTGMALL